MRINTNEFKPVIDQIIARIRGNCGVVILDIDETIFNSVPGWRKKLNAHMNLDLVDQDIEQAGGVDGVFRNGPRYAEFLAVAHKLRGDPTFNIGQPLMEGVTQGVKRLLEEMEFSFGAYITARPTPVAAVTAQELARWGLPSSPILARPEHIPRDDSTQWKMAILHDLRELYDGTIIMIDDSLSLARAIQRRNATSNRPIVSVLLCGPISYVAIEREHVVSVPADHLYVVPTWHDIPAICANYRTDKNAC